MVMLLVEGRTEAINGNSTGWAQVKGKQYKAREKIHIKESYEPNITQPNLFAVQAFNKSAGD